MKSEIFMVINHETKVETVLQFDVELFELSFYFEIIWKLHV